MKSKFFNCFILQIIKNNLTTSKKFLGRYIFSEGGRELELQRGGVGVTEKCTNFYACPCFYCGWEEGHPFSFVVALYLDTFQQAPIGNMYLLANQ